MPLLQIQPCWACQDLTAPSCYSEHSAVSCEHPGDFHLEHLVHLNTFFLQTSPFNKEQLWLPWPNLRVTLNSSLAFFKHHPAISSTYIWNPATLTTSIDAIRSKPLSSPAQACKITELASSLCSCPLLSISSPAARVTLEKDRQITLLLCSKTSKSFP